MSNKQVFWDICCTPSVVGSMTAGLSCLIIAWGLSTIPLAIVGCVLTLGSVGWGFTNYIFKYEDYVNAALNKTLVEEQTKRKTQLTQLKNKLQYNDAQVYDLLVQMIETHELFHRSVVQTKVSRFITPDMIEKADSLFYATAQSIEDAYNMSVEAKLAKGEIKQSLLRDRSNLITEVKAGVEKFTEQVKAFREMNASPKKEGIAKLAEELNYQMDIARQTEVEFRKLQSDTGIRQYE